MSWGVFPSACERSFVPFDSLMRAEASAVVVPIARRTRQVVLIVAMLPVVTQRKRNAAAITTNQKAIWVRARVTGSTPSGRRRHGSRKISVLAAKNAREMAMTAKTIVIDQNIHLLMPMRLNRQRLSLAWGVTAVGKVIVSAPDLRVSVTLLGMRKAGLSKSRWKGSSAVLSSSFGAATDFGVKANLSQ